MDLGHDCHRRELVEQYSDVVGAVYLVVFSHLYTHTGCGRQQAWSVYTVVVFSSFWGLHTDLSCAPAVPWYAVCEFFVKKKKKKKEVYADAPYGGEESKSQSGDHVEL